MSTATKDNILAILREARDQNTTPLLRTALIKYLYLLDVYFAEENNGVTWSKWHWKFLHYGPFASDAAATIDHLVDHKLLSYSRREAVSGDKEFQLYDLPDSKNAPNLSDIGIPASIRLRIQADLKRYGNRLPLLLDYVDFHTTPMAEASPGKTLVFDQCQKLEIQDVRPIQMKSLSRKAIKRTREQLRKLIEERKTSQVTSDGLYDETYLNGLEIMDGKSIDEGLKDRAILKSDKQ